MLTAKKEKLQQSAQQERLNDKSLTNCHIHRDRVYSFSAPFSSPFTFFTRKFTRAKFMLLNLPVYSLSTLISASFSPQRAIPISLRRAQSAASRGLEEQHVCPSAASARQYRRNEQNGRSSSPDSAADDVCACLARLPCHCRARRPRRRVRRQGSRSPRDTTVR